MKKKALLSLALIAVLAFGLGLGTYAWFTSQATSTNNQFQAGELKVALTDDILGNKVTLSDPATLGNLKPGDQQDFTFRVDNTGSLDMKYRFTLTAVNGKLSHDSTVHADANSPLEVSFDNGISWEDIGGTLTWVGDAGTLTLAPNDPVAVHTVLVRLPQESGNYYQGGTVSFKVKVEATQTDNGSSDGWSQ